LDNVLNSCISSEKDQIFQKEPKLAYNSFFT
jgi:hypothetical protein